MNISSDESCNGVAVILPVLGFIAIRYGSQLSRSNEHIGVKHYRGNRNQPDHQVVMEHVLEFVPLPSGIEIVIN